MVFPLWAETLSYVESFCSTLFLNSTMAEFIAVTQVYACVCGQATDLLDNC